MRSLVISRDRDVLMGMRLAGIEGIYCKDADELREAFNSNLEKNYGIIAITEEDFELISELVIDVKLNRKLPLVATIPGMSGLKDENFILKYIKESIGVKVD